MLATHRLAIAVQALVLFLLCGRLSATWSIIIIDTRTGEIAVGSATCIGGADLRALTAVIVVGKGGACAQSSVDTTGANRRRIWNGFRAGRTPAQILAELAANDGSHQTRQYGIVDTEGRSLGFTGRQASAWKGHVTGKVGTLVYAIQGNLLAGAPVVNAAEAAVRNTPGDLAAKLMAGMEAARARGGDARCNPRKSADIGFMIVARLGDRDGACNGNVGCAAGRYYMNLNVRGVSSSPDPVFTLWNLYHRWRKQTLGRPDHYNSEVTFDSATLPADGKTRTTVRVRLRDWTGGPVLQNPNNKVEVQLDPSSTAQATIGPVSYQPGGTYTFDVTAGSTVGLAKLQIDVDDGTTPNKIRLGPVPTLPITPQKLWISQPTVSAATGGNVELVINQGVGNAGRPYVLLGTLSGTKPGFAFGGVQVPLNPDVLSSFILQNLGSLPGFLGTVDGTGRQVASIAMPARAFGLPVPSQFHFATLLLNPASSVSEPVGLQLIR